MKDAIAKVTNKIKKTIKSINWKSKKTLLFVGFFVFALATSVILVSYSFYTEKSDKSLVIGGYAFVSNSDISLKIYTEDKDTDGNGLGTYSRVYFIPALSYTYNSSMTYCTSGISITGLENQEFKISATKKGYCKVYFDSVDGYAPSGNFRVFVEQTKDASDYEEVAKIPNNDYVYSVNTTRTSCTDSSAVVTYNKRRVDVQTSTDTDCLIYLDIENTTGGSQMYLSDKVLALESSGDYTSSQDKTVYIVTHEIVEPPIMYKSEFQNLVINNNAAATTTYTEGGFTFTSGMWTSTTASFSNQEYNIQFSFKKNGNYKVCYDETHTSQYSAGTKFVQKNGAQIHNGGNISDCVSLGELTTSDVILFKYRVPSAGDGSYIKVRFINLDELLDAGIRYEGKNPDNYITFNGETAGWRIIGDFEGSTIGLEPGKYYTKIIKDEKVDEWAWDCEDHNKDGDCDELGENENDWVHSTTNKVLNGAYLNGMSDSDKIAKYNGEYSTWYLRTAEFYTEVAYDSSSWYLAERISGVTGHRNGVQYAADAETKAAIGLMYPSDFGYAAYGDLCDVAPYKDLYNYESGCAAVDWLAQYSINTSNVEWIITPNFEASEVVLAVHGNDGGYINGDRAKYPYAIRPTLYLSSDVYITGGNGSQADPYTIDL